MPKVLIVEDYPDLCEFFTLLLQLNDFEVQNALSKTELITKLKSFTPDLILLDVMLAGDDGRDICKEIKEKHKEISIILISANSKLLLQYEEYHADAVIEKPFNNQDILDTIKHVIEAHAAKTP